MTQTMDDATVEWIPPGPGPWQQDSAHSPMAATAVMQELYPAGFNKGFTETFARYGLLLDRLAMGTVNGFTYHQPQPFDLPGPDGPLTPEQIGAEFERRLGVAARVFETRQWREDLHDWDTARKPAAVRRHRQLGDVDLAALDDAALVEHLRTVAGHVEAMVYQHHRYNMAALLPVGDFLLQAGALLGRPPTTLLGVLDGHSPVSGLVPPELEPVVAALATDADGRALLDGPGDPAERVDHLRARVPAFDEFVRAIGHRLAEGFDVVHPTQGECPEILLGRVARALDARPDEALLRAETFADSLRAELGDEDRARFDELLAEARLVYRLRDERGLYSDISAIGLLRLALLEVGRRAHRSGRLADPRLALDATITEAEALLGTEPGPLGEVLVERAATRAALSASGAPRYLGPPPPPPPPVDQLPPPLARLMAATGFLIEGILGQLDAPGGDADQVSGIGASAGVVEGTARLVHGPGDLTRLQHGDILVAPATGEAVNSVLHLLQAIVTDHGSFASHAGIVAREMGFPAVVGTVDGSRRIIDGCRIRVDGDAGVVTFLE
jgi:rifampicin phosphotransferase